MTTMAKPTIDGVRERARGHVITPTDDGYEEARKVYNGMIDRRPSVVIRAVDVGDVMAGVDYARENGLDLSVRGGSHSVPGYGTCDGGVVIDLSQMKGVRSRGWKLSLSRSASNCSFARRKRVSL